MASSVEFGGDCIVVNLQEAGLERTDLVEKASLKGNVGFLKTARDSVKL